MKSEQIDRVDGKVTLYREGTERLEINLEKSVGIQTQFVTRYFARRVNSEAEIGELINGFDGKTFRSRDEFIDLAHDAVSMEYLRNVDGRWVQLTRRLNRHATVGTAGNQLVGECFDCAPSVPGYCREGWICSYRAPKSQYCPCLYCGYVIGGNEECCEIYQ